MRSKSIAAALVIAGGIALAVLLTQERSASMPIGMTRATEIHIAPEISGRVGKILYPAGTHVTAGTVLVELESPELTAAIGEARAAVGQAMAARDRVRAGPRQEQVDIAAREIEKSKANLVLAEQQFKRASALAGSGNLAVQALDTARAQVSTARAELQSAEAAHRMSRQGATAEQLALADRKVDAAEASLAVVVQRAEKLRLLAPCDGTIGTVVADPGEATVPRRTSLTLVADGGVWFAFNLREDDLGSLTIGSRVTLATADGGTIAASVTELRRLDDYATWRAARAVGDHDLNMFFLRADPLDAATRIEPGRTIWIQR